MLHQDQNKKKVNSRVIVNHLYNENLTWTQLAVKLGFSANYTRDICVGSKPLTPRFENALQRVIGMDAVKK